MLADLSAQARLADALGYDSISFTEHHFHVEGFELSTNPVLLDLFVAMQTKRIRVGQLGIVLPAENPIRVAENIAMLDHMTGGRANAGFARGYQRRWVDVMAQQTHGIHGALPHQHDAVDEANRAAFEECLRIIKQAWTADLLSYEGRYWRIPPGATPWDLESTRRYGAGVVDGMLRDVVVAETDDEAMALWADSGLFCGREWFEPFGFSKGLVDPATGEAPSLFDTGLALVGSVDTVRRQLERLRGRLPVRWLFAWTYNGLIPHAQLMRSIELFATRVLPRAAGAG